MARADEPTVPLARRRGRPFRLPSDHSPMPGWSVDSAQRVSWLLASSRLHSSDTVARSRVGFAAHLNALGISADPTRISRWESGQHQVPDKVIAAYGKVLGHRSGVLSSVTSGIRRSLDPQASSGRPPVSEPLLGATELDDLFARLDGGEHDGRDWTTLAAALESEINLYLPLTMWERLATQLLHEAIRSTGSERVRRFEACRSLCGHPQSQHAILRAVGELVVNPGAQLVESAMTLLQEVSDSQATELILRLLRGPPGPVRRGAAWVTTCKLARGQFDDDAMDLLTLITPHLLTESASIGSLGEGIDILAALDETRQEFALGKIKGAARVHELLDILDWGELVSPDRSHRAAEATARLVKQQMPNFHPAEPDDMLVRLIRESLFHVHRERRHQAATLLNASPYAPHLGEALIQALGDGDPLIVSRMLALLMYLVPGEAGRAVQLRWASEHPDTNLRARSIMALIQLDPPIDLDQQRRFAEVARSSHDAALRTAALFLLGWLRSNELHRLIETGDEVQREEAIWWLSLGPVIPDGAAAVPGLP